MATPSVDPSVLGHPPPEPIDYSENDDEVDQLDSDSDPQDGVTNPDASSVSSQNLKGTKDGERLPGYTLLPTVRLENIIQADGVTGNLSMSKEALFVLSVATEEFIKRMSQAGHRQASTDRRNVVNYRDMASTIQQYQEFMFLHDTVPYPIPLAEALQRREAKQKAMLEEDPALSSSLPEKTTGQLPGNVYVPKGKGKARTINGKEKSTASASSKKRGILKDGRWTYAGENVSGDRSVDGVEVSWPSGTWTDDPNAYRPSIPQPTQNGMPLASTSYLHDARFMPLARPIASTSTTRPADEHTDRPQPLTYHHPTFHPQDDSWPGQYTGPASGFLQPHGPFGRIPSNPGRTIYTQQHRNEPDTVQ